MAHLDLYLVGHITRFLELLLEVLILPLVVPGVVQVWWWGLSYLATPYFTRSQHTIHLVWCRCGGGDCHTLLHHTSPDHNTTHHITSHIVTTQHSRGVYYFVELENGQLFLEFGRAGLFGFLTQNSM